MIPLGLFPSKPPPARKPRPPSPCWPIATQASRLHTRVICEADEGALEGIRPDRYCRRAEAEGNAGKKAKLVLTLSTRAFDRSWGEGGLDAGLDLLGALAGMSHSSRSDANGAGNSRPARRAEPESPIGSRPPDSGSKEAPQSLYFSAFLSSLLVSRGSKNGSSSGAGSPASICWLRCSSELSSAPNRMARLVIQSHTRKATTPPNGP